VSRASSEGGHAASYPPSLFFSFTLSRVQIICWSGRRDEAEGKLTRGSKGHERSEERARSGEDGDLKRGKEEEGKTDGKRERLQDALEAGLFKATISG